MGPLFGLLVAATVGSIVYLFASERQRRRLAAWRAVAAEAGLEAVVVTPGNVFSGDTLTARSGPLRLKFETYRRGKHESGTRLVVSGLGHGSGGLTLRREGLATAIEKGFIGEREIEVGDRAFDDEYYVQGHPAIAFSVLDSETRRAVARLLRGHLRDGAGSEARVFLSDGVLTLDLRERPFSDPAARIPAALAAALEVGRRLVAPPDPAARIAERLDSEPSAGVRLQGVLLLAREFATHPATAGALRRRLADADAEVRLRAATALGGEGRETLLALVRDATLPDGLVARAVTALGADLPDDAAETTLREALGEARRPETAIACLEALGRRGRTEVEGIAVEALGSSEPKVRTTAARTLGRIGTVAAVAALHDAMPPRGELLRSTGRQAIAEIQARLSGAAPGQLSLAGAEAGALSLAGGEAGGLSLTWDEDEGEEGAERVRRIPLARRQGTELGAPPPKPVREPPSG